MNQVSTLDHEPLAQTRLLFQMKHCAVDWIHQSPMLVHGHAKSLLEALDGSLFRMARGCALTRRRVPIPVEPLVPVEDLAH